MSQVQDYYNYLHTIPEKSLEEHKTSQFLADQLESFGYRVIRQVGGATGVIGIYDTGRPGPVVAIRADMDSLTHIIDGQEVQRHTCGHDGHMSMVLTAAKWIKEGGLISKGVLKILFQPAEETGEGALSMIKGGAIDDVDWLFGAHVRPFEECQVGQASPAIHYAAARRFVVEFHGKPAHAARPHLGVNAIDAATAAVNAVNAIHLKPTDNYSVKATRFLCDSGVTNAIPDLATVTWDSRAQYNDVMEALEEKFMVAIEGGAGTVGAKANVAFKKGTPAAELDEDATALLSQSIKAVLGDQGLAEEIYTPGSEDFFFYTIHKPSLKAGFFGLGCDLRPGLHHPDMAFDTSALDAGVAIFIKTVESVLN